MELTSRRKRRGRLVFNFAGYHPEDEMDLFKYLKKSLTTIVTNHPALVSDSLRRVIQPSWMPAPPPLPEPAAPDPA